MSDDDGQETLTTEEAIGRWWWSMTSREGHAGGASLGARRAALARLRRARTPAEALSEPLLLVLFRHPAIRRYCDPNFLGRAERVAIAAMCLAHVREDQRGLSIGRAIGRTSQSEAESALLSESRFRRLLLADDDELADAFRRLVQQLRGIANVRDLARLILHWDRERTREHLIFDYYAAAIAAPAETVPIPAT